jgi:hypothetical protein
MPRWFVGEGPGKPGSLLVCSFLLWRAAGRQGERCDQHWAGRGLGDDSGCLRVALTAGGRAAILLVGPLGLDDTSPIVVGLTIHISDPPNLDLGLGYLSWTGQILLLVFTWAVNPESRSKRGIKHHGKSLQPPVKSVSRALWSLPSKSRIRWPVNQLAR